MSGTQTTTESVDSDVVGGVVVDDDDDDDVGYFVDVDRNHHTPIDLETDQQQTVIQHLADEMAEGDRLYEALTQDRQIDLVEVCAPWDSPLCQAVRELGGTAVALGIHNGFDLGTMQGFRKALEVIRKLRPRYVHVSPPCTLWSSFQNCAQRDDYQKFLFEKARQVDKKFVNRCCRILEVQCDELNGHGGGEHPLTAQSWGSTIFGKMARKLGGRFSVYGCCRGMFHLETKKLIKKPWGWFSSSSHVRSALESRCTHHAHEHVPIEGALTASTAVYPRVLCRRFAKAILKADQ